MLNDMVQHLKLILSAEGAGKAEGEISKLGKAVKTMGATIAVAAVAFAGLKKAMALANTAMKEYERSQIAMRQISGVLESTGKNAMFTAQELSKLAGELQVVSNFGDEDILQGVTNELLRFDGISKDVFIRAQGLAVDLGEAMGGLENATRTLGISLADPELGITRLRRAGVMFTETQQDMIKGLIAAGDKAKAQTIMLEALESKYGGLAMASVSATKQMQNAWGDFMEAMGKSLGFVDGIKKGITAMLSDIASQIDIVSKDAQVEALELQLMWAETTVEIGNKAVSLIEVIGKYSMSVVNTLGTAAKTIMGIMELIGGIGHGIIALNKDIISDAVSDFKEIMNTVGGVWIAWDAKFRDAGRDRSEDIERQIAHLREMTKRQIESLDVATIVPGLGDDDEKATQEIKAFNDLIGNKLRALANYYDMVGKYSEEWLTNQIELYEHDLRAASDAFLSEQEIAEMVTARRIELQDEIRDNNEKSAQAWKALLNTQLTMELEIAKSREQWHEIRLMQIDAEVEAYREAGVNIVLLEKWKTEQINKLTSQVPEQFHDMADYMEDIAKRMQESSFRILEDGIYNLISGTNNLRDAWSSALESMRDITNRIISQIISKLIDLYIVQQLVGMVAGTVSPSGAGGSVAGGKSIGNSPSGGYGNIGMNLGDTTTRSLTNAINRLQTSLEQDRNPNFNLYMDGVQLRNAIVRTSTRMNIMGGGSSV